MTLFSYLLLYSYIFHFDVFGCFVLAIFYAKLNRNRSEWNPNLIHCFRDEVLPPQRDRLLDWKSFQLVIVLVFSLFTRLLFRFWNITTWNESDFWIIKIFTLNKAAILNKRKRDPPLALPEWTILSLSLCAARAQNVRWPLT